MTQLKATRCKDCPDGLMSCRHDKQHECAGDQNCDWCGRELPARPEQHYGVTEPSLAHDATDFRCSCGWLLRVTKAEQIQAPILMETARLALLGHMKEAHGG